jgi:murein L,D-transpeptidase YafK
MSFLVGLGGELLVHAQLSPIRYLTGETTLSRCFYSALLGTILVVGVCLADRASADSPLPAAHTRIVIFKEQRILELSTTGEHTKRYRVCLGTNPEGPKRITGDGKTPEGDYVICYKSTASQFHRFLGLSYPTALDAQASFEKGMISLNKLHSIVNAMNGNRMPPWDTELGGWVGIHGYPSDPNHGVWASILYPKPHNWTDGCIAMWNFEIEELYRKVPVGTPVSIVP